MPRRSTRPSRASVIYEAFSTLRTGAPIPRPASPGAIALPRVQVCRTGLAGAGLGAAPMRRRRPAASATRSDAAFASAVAVLAYLNCVRNGFVFDDHPAIERNPVVQDAAGGWRAALGTDFWGTPLADARSHHSYRPLAVLTLWFDRHLGMPGASGFHLTNVLLHAAATSLVCSLAALALPGRRAVALGAALLFATHPLNTEATAYCVGRADLLAAVLGLAGLRTHAAASACTGDRAATALRFAAAGLLCLALGCKETALMLLPTCAVWDILLPFHHAPSPRRWSRLMLRWSGLAAAAAAFGWVRAVHVGP